MNKINKHRITALHCAFCNSVQCGLQLPTQDMHTLIDPHNDRFLNLHMICEDCNDAWVVTYERTTNNIEDLTGLLGLDKIEPTDAIDECWHCGTKINLNTDEYARIMLYRRGQQALASQACRACTDPLTYNCAYMFEPESDGCWGPRE